MIYPSIVETIGNTPIVRLNRTGPDHVEIYVKVESFNPMASVKDRLAWGIIQDAERRGELRPGQTVVEATSGNTGIALAMVCAARGYPFVAIMAESFSVERRKLMKALGARVILTPVDASEQDVSSISALWQGVGARIKIMDPDEHDEVFAWVSHMPHMAAYAIIDSVLERDPELVDLSGGGLKDYTRIAASSPRMWADIAVANRAELLAATRSLGDSVNRIISALEEGDRDRLESIFEKIAVARRSSK